MERFSTEQGDTSWIRAYYPAFNGLRGIAILGVFICHYATFLPNSGFVHWCWIGVDLFFVLSGFLITGILHDSVRSKTFYRTFYERRALRILPLYYGVLCAIYLSTWIGHNVSVHGTFSLNLVYLENLALPFLNWDTQNPTVVRFLYHPAHTMLELKVGVFWTLCVEEQFYLIWPLVVRHFGSRERLMRFCSVAILAVLVTRVLLFFVLPANLLVKGLLYTSTYTRCDELLMGAWCALWLRGVRLSRSKLRRLCYAVLLPSLGLFVVGVTLVQGGDVDHVTNAFVSTAGFTLIGLMASSVLLLSLDITHPFARIACLRPLQALGEVSYGVYIFHMLPLPFYIYFLKHTVSVSLFGTLGLFICFLVVYATARISLHLLEEPIMRLKYPRKPPTQMPQRRMIRSSAA